MLWQIGRSVALVSVTLLLGSCQKAAPPRSLAESVRRFPPVEGERVEVSIKNASKVAIEIHPYIWGPSDTDLERLVTLAPGQEVTIRPWETARAKLAFLRQDATLDTVTSPRLTSDYGIGISRSDGRPEGNTFKRFQDSDLLNAKTHPIRLVYNGTDLESR